MLSHSTASPRRRSPRRPGRGGRTPPPPPGPASWPGPGATASVIVRPARWLSLTSTKSDSEPRWLTPPPARTAAFSSARSPGVVLRVSHTRHAGLAAAAASTNRRVSEATPERWQRKLRAVRSAVSTDASGPVTVAITSPGPRRSPSPRCQVTVDRRVELGERLASTQARAGQHALGARAQRRRHLCVRRHERGGEVAEGPEVLGEGPRHRLVDGSGRWVERRRHDCEDTWMARPAADVAGWRAACGLVGPAVFTAAWLVNGLRQPRYPVADEHISGLAALDAEHPVSMITGFVTLGTCTVVFAAELRRRAGRRAPATGAGPGAARHRWRGRRGRRVPAPRRLPAQPARAGRRATSSRGTTTATTWPPA